MSDAIAAFLLLLEKGAVGEVYNVGSSWEVPILGLAQQLVKTVGCRFCVSFRRRAEDSQLPSAGQERSGL